MWFVYIILCGDNSLYTGITNDLKKRFLEHQSGQGSRYTRAKKVVKIIYKEPQSSHSLALKREYEIKSWTRAKKIKILKLNLK